MPLGKKRAICYPYSKLSAAKVKKHSPSLDLRTAGLHIEGAAPDCPELLYVNIQFIGYHSCFSMQALYAVRERVERFS